MVALTVAALAASMAYAQDSAGPLRFLKPSIDDVPPPAEAAEQAAPTARGAVPPTETALEPEPQPEAQSPASPSEMRAPPPVAEGEAASEPGTSSGTTGALPQAAASAPPDEPGLEAAGAAGGSVDDGYAPEAEAPQEPAPPGPLRFGVIAGRDIMATLAAVEPVTQDLERLLGRPVEILPMSSHQAMVDAQVQHRIDGGFYAAAAYALAETQCRCLEPLAAPAASDGTSAYHAVIVARRSSAISSAAGLEGRTVAAGAADSVGGRGMQLAGLMAEGIDPRGFGSVIDAGSAADAVRLMLSGGADAAFAWSSLFGDLEHGYSRGTLADLVASGEITMQDVAIIWRSLKVAHGPVAVMKSMSDADKQAMEAYLLDLANHNPRAYDAINPYYEGGYVAVEPADYEGLKVLTGEAVEALRLPGAPTAAGLPVPAAGGLPARPR